MENLTDKFNSTAICYVPEKNCQNILLKAVKYIQSCRLNDGGYFFARIPPSSGLDTYYAVRSLAILGLKPERPRELASFFLEDLHRGTLNGITAVFLAVEVLHCLNLLPDSLKNYAEKKIKSLQKPEGGFGSFKNINIEVPSELEDTFRAVKVLNTIGADFNRNIVRNFISRFLTAEGGYGNEGLATLASTYYAIEILKLSGTDISNVDSLKKYLRTQEVNRPLYFIEDLYWLTMSLASLNEKPSHPQEIVDFVLGCQRPGGGFARAILMGIPTLEYTFYALSILKVAGFFNNISLQFHKKKAFQFINQVE